MYNLGLVSSAVKHPLHFFVLIMYKLRVFTKPQKVLVNTFFGTKMNVYIPEIVSSLLYLTGRYEPDVEDTLIKFIKPGDVFIDIGAHIGYFSLLGSYLVKEKGLVIAFEPTHSTYKLLLENCKQMKNIITVNKACYSKKTKLEFNDFGLQYSALNSFFNPRIQKEISSKSIVVQTVDLDSYLKQYKKKPNFIKIDAESSEYEILRGMENTLKECKPVLFLELGDMGIKNVTNSTEILKYLSTFGYKPFQYKKGYLTEYRLELLKKHTNVLFIVE